MKKICLDNAATTFVDNRVLKAMMPYFSDEFGNPASIHSFGQRAEAAALKARDIIADFLGCESDEIIFTSGATESNNIALKGIFTDYKGHLITTSFEHHSVLNTAKFLSERGVDVSFIKPEKSGIIDYRKIIKAIKPSTRLISMIYANNEIGTIQPITKIGKELVKINTNRANKVLFHTDAVQATYFLPIKVSRLRVDLMSISSHKIYGPKGAGVLYIKQNTKITPLFHGGYQEYGLRAGTLNVPAIVGFGKAIDLIKSPVHKKEVERIKKLRDYLINKVLKIENTYLNGDKGLRLPNNANFLFENVEGESLLMKLDFKGVACSTGSACASGSLEVSHVLSSIGISPERAHGSLRVSIGKRNTIKDIDYFVSCLKKIVKELRNYSPIS